MKRYQDIVGRINYGLFLAVVALLPFPQTPLRLACVLWIISWYLEFRWLTKPKSLRENPVAIPILLFGLWFAWKVVSVFWAPDYDAWAWQMERYMTFALIIPIGLWGVNEHYNWEQAGKVLVASCVIAIPAYLIWMAVLHPHPEWVPYLNVPEDWCHHEKWTTFLMDNISHFKHRLFLCSVELFGIIMAFQVLRKRLAILIPAVAIMFISIPMTGSRQSVLTCAALAVIGILYLLPRKQRLRYGTAIVLLGMVLGGGVLKLHPRMQQFDIRDITEMRDMSYDHDIRFNIWGRLCSVRRTISPTVWAQVRARPILPNGMTTCILIGTPPSSTMPITNTSKRRWRSVWRVCSSLCWLGSLFRSPQGVVHEKQRCSSQRCSCSV